LTMFNNVQLIMYVPHSCNRVAHRLASEGADLQNSSINMWPDCVPDFANYVVIDDLTFASV
jgi:hypothetical protein